MASVSLWAIIRTKGTEELTKAWRESEKLRTSLDGVTTSASTLDRGMKGAAGVVNNNTKQFSKLSQGLGGLVHVYATLAANVFAATAAFNVFRSAARFEQLTQSMTAFTVATGVGMRSIVEGMRDVTDGALSIEAAMRSAAQATAGGFSGTQIAKITEVAAKASKVLGRDMQDSIDRLTRGLVKLEPELIDELGLMTRVDVAARKYADSVGKNATQLSQFEKRMAFANAVLEEGIDKFGEVGELVKSNPYDRIAASIENLKQNLVPAANAIAKVLEVITENIELLGLAIAGLAGYFGRKLFPDFATYFSNVGRDAERAIAALEDTKARAATTILRDPSTGPGSIHTAGLEETRNLNKRILEEQRAGTISVENAILARGATEVSTTQTAIRSLEEKLGVIALEEKETRRLGISLTTASAVEKVNLETTIALLKEKLILQEAMNNAVKEAMLLSSGDPKVKQKEADLITKQRQAGQFEGIQNVGAANTGVVGTMAAVGAAAATVIHEEVLEQNAQTDRAVKDADGKLKKLTERFKGFGKIIKFMGSTLSVALIAALSEIFVTITLLILAWDLASLGINKFNKAIGVSTEKTDEYNKTHKELQKTIKDLSGTQAQYTRLLNRGYGVEALTQQSEAALTAVDATNKNLTLGIDIINDYNKSLEDAFFTSAFLENSLEKSTRNFGSDAQIGINATLNSAQNILSEKQIKDYKEQVKTALKDAWTVTFDGNQININRIDWADRETSKKASEALLKVQQKLREDIVKTSAGFRELNEVTKKFGEDWTSLINELIGNTTISRVYQSSRNQETALTNSFNSVETSAYSLAEALEVAARVAANPELAATWKNAEVGQALIDRYNRLKINEADGTLPRETTGGEINLILVQLAKLLGRDKIDQSEIGRLTEFFQSSLDTKALVTGAPERAAEVAIKRASIGLTAFNNPNSEPLLLAKAGLNSDQLTEIRKIVSEGAAGLIKTPANEPILRDFIDRVLPAVQEVTKEFQAAAKIEAANNAQIAINEAEIARLRATKPPGDKETLAQIERLERANNTIKASTQQATIGIYRQALSTIENKGDREVAEEKLKELVAQRAKIESENLALTEAEFNLKLRSANTEEEIMALLAQETVHREQAWQKLQALHDISVKEQETVEQRLAYELQLSELMEARFNLSQRGIANLPKERAFLLNRIAIESKMLALSQGRETTNFLRQQDRDKKLAQSKEGYIEEVFKQTQEAEKTKFKEEQAQAASLKLMELRNQLIEKDLQLLDQQNKLAPTMANMSQQARQVWWQIGQTFRQDMEDSMGFVVGAANVFSSTINTAVDSFVDAVIEGGNILDSMREELRGSLQQSLGDLAKDQLKQGIGTLITSLPGMDKNPMIEAIFGEADKQVRAIAESNGYLISIDTTLKEMQAGVGIPGMPKQPGEDILLGNDKVLEQLETMGEDSTSVLQQIWTGIKTGNMQQQVGTTTLANVMWSGFGSLATAYLMSNGDKSKAVASSVLGLVGSVIGSAYGPFGAAAGGQIGSMLGGLFKNGGVMTPYGPANLYSEGGIANSPQLAMYGEGRTPEAYVPLPDGKTIPVTMSGGSMVNNDISISVSVAGNGSTTSSVSASDRENTGAMLGVIIANGVKQQIANEMRPGGLLYKSRS